MADKTQPSKYNDDELKDQLLPRFLDYVKTDTSSSEESETSPSTEKQFSLAKKLVDELKGLGLDDASVDEHCYVTATLKGNLPDNTKVPVVGLIAHLDTSPAVSGTNVKPIVHKNYQGGDLVLSPEVTIKSEDNPSLKSDIGDDIITSDGTTLLGADDKAGIAEIVTAFSYLKANPSIKHGTIKVAFTPDEEIGKGTDHFDVKKFGAKYAYTIDGGGPGEIEDETFNAAKATYKIKGVNVHPGYAKNKLVNSQKIAAELIDMLPDEESPEKTEGDQGYFHITDMSGNVEETNVKLIIRDFDKTGLERRKNVLKACQEQLNALHGAGTVGLTIADQYPNMKTVLDKYPEVTEIAKEAMKRVGVEPTPKKIRGGTDGATLSLDGLPTPNLFAGGLNFHSRTEYVPVKSMVKATKNIIELVQLYAETQV